MISALIKGASVFMFFWSLQETLTVIHMGRVFCQSLKVAAPKLGLQAHDASSVAEVSEGLRALPEAFRV